MPAPAPEAEKCPKDCWLCNGVGRVMTTGYAKPCAVECGEAYRAGDYDPDQCIENCVPCPACEVRALKAALAAAKDRGCPYCGRPWPMHKYRTEPDHGVITCPRWS